MKAESAAAPAAAPSGGDLQEWERQASLRAPAMTLQRAARDGGQPLDAGKLLRLLVEGHPDPGRRQATTSPAATKAAPLSSRRILPYPIPLGNPRSSILGDLTARRIELRVW